MTNESERAAFEVLKAIANGYPYRIEHGIIVVENPKYQEDNGSAPNLIIETRAALDAKNMEGVCGESQSSEATYVHKDDNLAPSALIEKVAEAVLPELCKSEMVLTDPVTLKRLQANRVAKAALAAISSLSFEDAATIMHNAIVNSIKASGNEYYGVSNTNDTIKAAIHALTANGPVLIKG